MCNTVVLAEWKDIHQYVKHGWLFRGQGDANWELKTSLERCFDRHGVKPCERRKIEDRIIREFRRAYHQFAYHVPDCQMIDQWLSIMQHHGTPTRLLDFTYSIYVAAYFAVEEAENDSAVWAVEAPWVKRQSVALLEKVGKRVTPAMIETTMDDDEKVATKLAAERRRD